MQWADFCQCLDPTLAHTLAVWVELWWCSSPLETHLVCVQLAPTECENIRALPFPPPSPIPIFQPYRTQSFSDSHSVGKAQDVIQSGSQPDDPATETLPSFCHLIPFHTKVHKCNTLEDVMWHMTCIWEEEFKKLKMGLLDLSWPNASIQKSGLLGGLPRSLTFTHPVCWRQNCFSDSVNLYFFIDKVKRLSDWSVPFILTLWHGYKLSGQTPLRSFLWKQELVCDYWVMYFGPFNMWAITKENLHKLIYVSRIHTLVFFLSLSGPSVDNEL